jgi:hypothetical protein
MAAFTPLGLLAPGGAFGEDRPADLDLHRYGLGAVPDGLAHYAGFFHNALFDGYGFANDAHPVLGYLVSAAVGLLAIAAVAAGAVAAARIWRRRRHAGSAEPRSDDEAAPGVPGAPGAPGRALAGGDGAGADAGLNRVDDGGGVEALPHHGGAAPGAPPAERAEVVRR